MTTVSSGLLNLCDLFLTALIQFLTFIRAALAADSSRDMSTPFAAAANAPQPGQAQDYNKLFKAEREHLEFAEGLHAWVAKDADTRILQKYCRPIPAS